MRILLLVTACVLVSGCLKPAAKATPKAQSQSVAEAVNSDCYTVDLFTKAKIARPDKKVPEAHRQFLGEWGGGAWNGFWCHDLVITNVHPDGTVELFEMLAPYAPWNYPATAFQRTARIDDKGVLRFAYGTERLSYRIADDGRLHGTRSGLYGNLSVKLSRRGVPPIPTPNPLRNPKVEEAT